MEVAGGNGPEVQAGKSGKLDNKRERIISVQKRVTYLLRPLPLRIITNLRHNALGTGTATKSHSNFHFAANK
jgi:hypothetical protein